MKNETKEKIKAIDFIKRNLQREINNTNELIGEEALLDKNEKEQMIYEVYYMRKLVKYLRNKKRGLNEWNKFWCYLSLHFYFLTFNFFWEYDL